MSCGYGTPGFQCDTVYTLGGTVSQERANEVFELGQRLGLTEFNPTSVNWDAPVEWTSTVANTSTIMELSEGYGMIFGFGIGLTLITVILTVMENRLGGFASNSENFNTAGRSVKTGLTGSVIVSQWTWAATLLQSSNVAWQYGITGPFWYAAGATIQILLFGILAVEIKRRAPNAHTFLEIIRVRWGTLAHLVFMFFGLAANAIVSAMLLLGGCAVFEATAGIPIVASSFIIPLLTLVYTLVGGLKATFLAGYVHTTVIMVILIAFVTIVYGIEQDCTDTSVSCVSLGSASLVYERLTFLVALPTRSGDANVTVGNTTVTVGGFHQGPANVGGTLNLGGSYLTIKSSDGLAFGIINIVGNFGTVFVDQSYWQSAIAAKPAAAHKGYILGGMVWFTIPFALATALGLAGNALNVALTADDAGRGLVPPASAIALLGPTGGYLVMTQLTMAILSTGSAECIAVSSLMAYDVYRTYINPNATGNQILWVSRVFVCVWAIVMACLSLILNEIGIGLGWVYNFMATALGSAVAPIACSVYTDKLNAFFAISAAVLGMACAIIAWFSVASTYGPLSTDTLGELYAFLAGGSTALVSSSLICALGCCVAPSNFDWNIMFTGLKLVSGDGGEDSKVLGDDYESSPEFLLAAKQWIFKYGWGYSFFLCVAWPVFAIPFGVFGKTAFQAWAAVALMWGWVAGLTIIFLPLYESMDFFKTVFCCGKAADKPVESTTSIGADSVTATVVDEKPMP
jgi:SSS family transporter